MTGANAPDRPRTAVITIARGRHRHLFGQQRGLRLGGRRPDVYVVVGMGDPVAAASGAAGPLAGTGCEVRGVDLVDGAGDGRLPLAAARNAGARAALAAGADVLIFLDVDCVPGPGLVESYTAAVAGEDAPALHCGVVQYLAPEVDATAVHPADLRGRVPNGRPRPGPGRSVPSDDWHLFWSLSFAVSAATWRLLGGFCEEYRGYGAEDTDLSYLAFRQGINLRWIGGADAFHQYHPSPSPPTQHLPDIVRNAGVFHHRWGFWPMQGWLTAFADLGLARYDADRDAWSLVATGSGSGVAGGTG
ncbi:glycosyltransferase family 2 protein [Nakamurella sp.]|uniref:glycosyltransferase family 2 protein n=1 Tax=Nakamurella sp. TaxID=1869182 RepID=UPI003B3B2388